MGDIIHMRVYHVYDTHEFALLHTLDWEFWKEFYNDANTDEGRFVFIRRTSG